MSYEGFVVCVCENGHYDIVDAYCDDEETCFECGAKFVHRGWVDETNGLPYILNFRVKQVTPEEHTECAYCGCKKQIKRATYAFESCESYEAPEGFLVENYMPAVLHKGGVKV